MQLSDSKPFIIAEVGSNWTSFEQAKDSISLAKACGADAVKFQFFKESHLYGPGVRDSTVASPNLHQLPEDWLPKLKEKADAVGIEFMCTAFDPQGYAQVDAFVKTHKIASAENTYPQLLEKVYSFGKPVILSLGATPESDIQAIMGLIDKKRTILMYCVAAYPSTEHNLFQIDGLRKLTGCNVGLSDHSTDLYTSLSAWFHFKAPVIEKHVNLFDVNSPDTGHSLDRTQFKILCDYLNGSLTNLEQVKPAREEEPMFLQHNRRLIATAPIKKGDQLRYGTNFGTYRSLKSDAKGFSPLAWDYFNGKVAERDFNVGDGICRN